MLLLMKRKGQRRILKISLQEPLLLIYLTDFQDSWIIMGWLTIMRAIQGIEVAQKQRGLLRLLPRRCVREGAFVWIFSLRAMCTSIQGLILCEAQTSDTYKSNNNFLLASWPSYKHLHMHVHTSLDVCWGVLMCSQQDATVSAYKPGFTGSFI